MNLANKFGGRSPLPEKVIRDQRIVTFLTKSECEKVLKITRIERKSKSAVCRELIVQRFQDNPLAESN
jgi:hypothetical protein